MVILDLAYSDKSFENDCEIFFMTSFVETASGTRTNTWEVLLFWVVRNVRLLLYVMPRGREK